MKFRHQNPQAFHPPAAGPASAPVAVGGSSSARPLLFPAPPSRSARAAQRGIALVITLVMLAIVTVMAIVFLAVSRRERTSVKMSEELSMANAMAEAALERAKAEAMARMSVAGSKLHYDLFNSTNFQAASYTPQPAASPFDSENVSYIDDKGSLLAGRDYLRMLANMVFDPRPPVFVETNENPQLPKDFRFYVDFNRNRSFESNGVVIDIAGNRQPIKDADGNLITNNVVGDPEWIGVLERGDIPHSETNRFVGRMAYLVLPVGKTLDINFAHNHVLGNAPSENAIDTALASQRNAFSRNQGVGSWEINLAAFFRELNTNAWLPATYRFRLGNGGYSSGASFDDARAILAFRYPLNRQNLSPATLTLGPGNPFNPKNGNRFQIDNVDNFGDGGLNGNLIDRGDLVYRGPLQRQLLDEDENDSANQNKPWPGSLNTNAFTDLQQLFSLEKYSPSLTNRLNRPMRLPASNYDRYTFYRLAAQLGVDSAPALEGKLHLNYDNEVGKLTNTFHRWTNAVKFFTNAAELMLKASIDRTVTRIEKDTAGATVTNTYYLIGDTLVRTNFSITNIQVYAPPTSDRPFDTGNEYTPTVHRLLQLALNIYDNTTNRGSAYPYFPTVLKPVYSKTASNLVITNFLELTNATPLQARWVDPVEYFTNGVGVASNFNFYGQHLILGAKKGLPNLNELALQSYVEVSRKLEVVKNASGGTVNDTNQMFLVSLFNRWGMEGWHSYTSSYPRELQILGDVRSQLYIRDLGTNNGQVVFATNLSTFNGFTTNNWPAGGFRTLVDRTFAPLRDVAYSAANGFRATNLVRFNNLEPAPRFQMVTTNDVRFWIRDTVANQIVDFVSFNDVSTIMDISTNLYAPPSAANQMIAGKSAFNDNMFWDPTPVSPNSPVTVGMTNQIAVSAGEIEVDDDTWKAYRFNSPDKRGGIAVFRSFIGLSPRSTDPAVRPSVDLSHQTPFVPTRRMFQLITWQANDPLVHYMSEDLTRTPNSDKPINLRIEQPLPEWNIGRLNDVYHPWGGHPQVDPKNDPFAFNVTLQDPGVRKSDDWEFPALDVDPRQAPQGFVYTYPNIGALGRVHRGTPWQTVFLKSVVQHAPNGQIVTNVHPTVWRNWAGSGGTYPANDWRLLDVFTTAPNENAARGLLSVNQANRAAWSAVLSGVAVATNDVRTSTLSGLGPNEGLSPTNTFKAMFIEPASPQVQRIVDSINRARALQFEAIPNPTPAANPRMPWLLVPKTNIYTQKPLNVFQSVGDVLSAPALSIQSPFLNNAAQQVRHVWTDRAVEQIPQQILSLLQRDEPRFVVYAFGQSLKPAPRSLTTSADFYNLCTNYQVTGEVITKTTFRVEGELRNPANPLRAVVESYNILPPPE